MSSFVTRVTYKSYSGPKVAGSSEFKLHDASDHWEKTLWLTSKVESGGRFGAINMYDGTAVTAGLHQAIAVFPRELADEDFNAKDDQGSFFSLLRLIQSLSSFDSLDSLISRFRDCGWILGRDGVLRYSSSGTKQVGRQKRSVKAGDPVFGFEIRETFTPNQGSVPASGPEWDQAASWASSFHSVFSHPDSYRPQIEFGAQHFEASARRKIVGGHTIEQQLYGGSISSFRPSTPALDLALCVFWSHSVNAPSVAYSLLSKVLEESSPEEDPDKFSKLLLKALATKNYGRWHWSEINGRWQRTRNNAILIWPSYLFSSSGVMPASM